MTLIKSLVFIIACGGIIPSFFVAYFFITFSREVSSFHPDMVRLIFLHGTERVRIIIS